MKKFSRRIGTLGVLLTASLLTACSGPEWHSRTSARSLAPGPVSLGAASTFAILGGGAGVTNQGVKTSVTGDLGTTGASTLITGFHSANYIYTETPLNTGAVKGSVLTAPPRGSAVDFALVTRATGDALAAFNNLAARPDGIDPGAGQLGGLTLVPGVYKSAAGSFLITGSDLVLDAKGDPNAVWIFQMVSSLVVGTPQASRSVLLANGAQAKNVFWQVGSAATINGGGGGHMVGTIIARAGITFSTAGNQTVSTLQGRALGLFAAVTLVNTVVDVNHVPVIMVPLIPAPVPVPQIVVYGLTASAVVPLVAGTGFLNIQNNGGLVIATENGSGTIAILNYGKSLTATNTGRGLMTISSNATGAVTVTNTGNGSVTVHATGADAVTVTHTGDDDFFYP